MSGKHALIIGGTRGIGRALLKILVRDGYAISVIGRRPPIEKDKRIPNASYWIVDLSDKTRLLKALEEIVLKNGKLTTLAFFQRYRGQGDPWGGELETSLTATKDIIEYFIDRFDSHQERSIVIVSSVAGYFVANEQPVSYHVGKAGLNQMVRYYAYTLGPKGIRVNAVSPGGAILKDESKHFYLKNKQLYNLYEKIIPLSRMGRADEIAEVAAFLCSKKASFVTGQNIIVDGGVSLASHESLARGLTPLRGLKVTREIKKESR